MRTRTRSAETSAHPRNEPCATTAPLSPKVLEELRCELESAVAFADYCLFLSAGRCRDRSAQLVEIAEALMAETVEALKAAERPG